MTKKLCCWCGLEKDDVGFHGHQCAYCDSSGSLEQDHFIPLTSGGGYTKDNILPACPLCNRRKSNRDPRAFINDEDRYEAILTLMSV